MKAVPYRAQLIEQMAHNIADKENPDYEIVLHHDIKKFTKHLTEVLDILHEFYTEHGLDSDEQM